MDTEAIAANEWGSLLGCASRVERHLKLSQRLVDEESLAQLEDSVKEYLARYRRFVESKKSNA